MPSHFSPTVLARVWTAIVRQLLRDIAWLRDRRTHALVVYLTGDAAVG